MNTDQFETVIITFSNRNVSFMSQWGPAGIPNIDDKMLLLGEP